MLGVIGRGINRLNEWVGKICCWLVLPLVVVLVLEVVARYLFGRPTVWAYDLAWMLCASLYILGGGYTLFAKGHVRVDLLYSRFPSRLRALVEAVCYLVFFFPFMVALGLMGGKYAYKAWILGEKSPYALWKPPVGPIKTIMVVGIFLLLLQALVEFSGHLKVLVKGGRHDS